MKIEFGRSRIEVGRRLGPSPGRGRDFLAAWGGEGLSPPVPSISFAQELAHGGSLGKSGPVLGSGAFGQAVTVVHPKREDCVAKQMNVTGEKKRQTKEVALLAYLAHVKGVVTLLGVVPKGDPEFSPGTPLMEMAGGGSLHSYITTRLLSHGEVQRLARELMKAVSGMHALGVAHRDIKPPNILLDENLHVKVADFDLGLRLTDGEVLVENKLMIGTPYYMPPEVIRPRSYDPKAADIWSAGAVIFSIATKGKRPFEADGEQIHPISYMFRVQSGRTQPNLSAVEDVELRDLIEKMLNSDPSERPTAEKVLQHPYFRKSFTSPSLARRMGNRRLREVKRAKPKMTQQEQVVLRELNGRRPTSSRRKERQKNVL